MVGKSLEHNSMNYAAMEKQIIFIKPRSRWEFETKEKCLHEIVEGDGEAKRSSYRTLLLSLQIAISEKSS